MSNAQVTICLDEQVGRINPNLYGHFAEHLGGCIYDGIWVGPDSTLPNVDGIRKDVIEALRRISPPVLRWPGGCFADDYHWEDGIGPREERPRRVNIWWGESIESNAFGTHELIQFCRLIGAEPYLCGNVGSGTPRELRDWVEYCNFAGDSTLARHRRANGSDAPFGVRYWGVGNENWGCGGTMCPGEYGAAYRRYATFLRDMGGTELFLIACGPSSNDTTWTSRLLDTLFAAGRMPRIHGLSAHYYCGTAGTATEYTQDEWYLLLKKAVGIEHLIQDQRRVMDEYDPERTIGLIVDEWGTWHPPTPGHHPRHLWQQNTMRDALVAALTLDIFNRYADQVVMANIAQTVNVLQAMILTDGPRMITTPTYHVYDLYQVHQGATSVRLACETSEVYYLTEDRQQATIASLAGSASIKDRALSISLVNVDAGHPIVARIDIRGGAGRVAQAQVLSHKDIHAHNTFDEPDHVRPVPMQVNGEGDTFECVLPPASVSVIRVNLGS